MISNTRAELTGEVLRRAYGMFPSGVVAVGAFVDSRPVGMAASSFTSVSIEPPLVSLCVARSSTTWPVLRTAKSLGISVLAAGHRDIVRQLAATTGDRFAGVAWELAGDQAVLLADAPLSLVCMIHDEVRAGDHDIVVLAVQSIVVRPDTSPIVFHASTLRALVG